MKCDECNGDTRVSETRKVEFGAVIRRTRVCENDSRHKFVTFERRSGHELAELWVRETTETSILPEKKFEPDRLLQDIRVGVLGRISDEEVRAVHKGVIENLTSDLAKGSIGGRLSEEDADALGERSRTYAILDTDITAAVERELKRRSRHMAHVLYSLSIRGRADREGRVGWRSAVDVVRWLHDAYPEFLTVDALRVATASPSPALIDRWAPRLIDTQPQHVVKSASFEERTIEQGDPREAATRHRKSDRSSEENTDSESSTRIVLRAQSVPFDLRRFERSIEKAMHGRPEAKYISQCVAQWVLWNLTGQQKIESSQLAVGVLDCLRRIDDIAYLRWAVVMKGLILVRDFYSEALALMTHPSVRLMFDPAPARTSPIPPQIL